MAPKRASKNSEKNSDLRLVVPKHGRGALLTGGKPGNRGGPCRPPSALRKKCQDSFEERVPILESIADNDEARDPDRIKAVEVLGKYGGVDKIALTLEEQPEGVPSPEELRERKALLLERIQRIKRVEDIEELMVSIAKEQVAIDA